MKETSIAILGSDQWKIPRVDRKCINIKPDPTVRSIKVITDMDIAPPNGKFETYKRVNGKWVTREEIDRIMRIKERVKRRREKVLSTLFYAATLTAIPSNIALAQKPSTSSPTPPQEESIVPFISPECLNTQAELGYTLNRLIELEPKKDTIIHCNTEITPPTSYSAG